MKKCFKIIISAMLLTVILSVDVTAQKKKVVKKSSAKTTVVKFTEKEFGTPTSISQVTDVADSSPSYESVRNLVETYGITTTYSDGTFRGKEPLRRGDFIVALNSAFTNIKKSMDEAQLDSSLINTYDKNASYITNVSELKDLNSNSIYYPATQGLVEKWGIAAPFTKTKLLNPGGTVSEKEVYDILNVTLGYNSAALNPYSTAMSRNKFAIVLNNAIAQKMSQVNALISEQRAKRDEERRRQMDSMQQAENIRKDSIAKEIEARKVEAAKQEEEARKKLSDKKKK